VKFENSFSQIPSCTQKTQDLVKFQKAIFAELMEDEFSKIDQLIFILNLKSSSFGQFSLRIRSFLLHKGSTDSISVWWTLQLLQINLRELFYCG
jgi:hypothetical protein